MADDNEEVNHEDSDTVVMNDDDAQSADSKVKTSSVDGEDGMVDVSMRDASDETDAATPSRDAESGSASSGNNTIAPGFQRLFDVKLVKSGEVVPRGFNSVEDHKNYPSMSSRVKAVQKAQKAKKVMISLCSVKCEMLC